MLDKIKLSMRISNNEFDSEIEDMINACESDLGISGVASTHLVDTDKLFVQAVINYCKAYFGLDNPDKDKYILAYEKIRTRLALD